MYTAYILQDTDGKLYKGCTNNLPRRLREHKSGQTITTSKMKELKLLYKEEFETLAQARARELYFKSAAGRRYIKKILGL